VNLSNKRKLDGKSKQIMEQEVDQTHIVPATRVLTWVVFGGRSFANPKSEILGVRSLSRRILLALISRWTICGWTSS